MHRERDERLSRQLFIVCREVAHRHKTVQHALFEMVESSCKLDPPESFYRRGLYAISQPNLPTDIMPIYI